MQQIVAGVIAALAKSWSCDVIVHRHSPIVSVADNYELLGFAADAVTRDKRYTRYVSDTLMLRSHTSALVPGLLRDVARAPYSDVLLACPGLVYRRDSIDRTHVGEPHHMDLWRVTTDPMGEADLEGMIRVVVESAVPGAEIRTTPSPHPYTHGGREVEVRTSGSWVEVAECGLTHPGVLVSAGLSTHGGLAMGVGLDRLLMLRKGIDDIRLLRSPDPRIAGQMLDLAPYRSVSAMPMIQRDLSIAVGGDVTVEELGDRARRALGARADDVEDLILLSETPAATLPPAAMRRLGAAGDQKNVLLRVVIRHPSRTLTDREANDLRNDIYAALHEGSVAHMA
jgi:phenylalanyl-tRNA synthetase alpha chain